METAQMARFCAEIGHDHCCPARDLINKRQFAGFEEDLREFFPRSHALHLYFSAEIFFRIPFQRFIGGGIRRFHFDGRRPGEIIFVSVLAGLGDKIDRVALFDDAF